MDARTGCCECDYGHSVTSAHWDMTIDNNSTWSDAWQFGDPDDTTWNLSGCTFSCDVQLSYYDAVPKLSLTSAGGEIIIDDDVQRVIHFNVAPADIQAALTPGVYVYDLLMTDAFGVVSAFMHGKLCVEQGVTGVT